jgi:hypothetical protein
METSAHKLFHFAKLIYQQQGYAKHVMVLILYLMVDNFVLSLLMAAQIITKQTDPARIVVQIYCLMMEPYVLHQFKAALII